MLLEMPLGLPKTGMATKIITIYRLRRDPSATIPQITICQKGKPPIDCNPDTYLKNMIEINEKIQEIDMKDYLDITIAYANTITITFIDTLGLITQAPDNSKINPKDVLDLVTHWVTVERPNDYILLFQKMGDKETAPPAVEELLKKVR